MTHIATVPDTITQPVQPTQPVYRMDRRTGERRDITGEVTALRFLQASRSCTTIGLTLRNMSDAGAAATSATAFEVGEVVALYFGMHANEGPVERIGRIVRCRSASELREHVIAALPAQGFEVGIEFDVRAAA